MNAVGYMRVSTDEQAKKNHSLAVQESRIREYASKNGVTLVKMFTDDETGRSIERRHDFKAMLKFCKLKSNRINAVIIQDSTRFARATLDYLVTAAELSGFGVRVIAVDEPYSDTAQGKFNQTVAAARSQLFSDELSEKTKYRMKAAVQDGRFPWPAPIGYLNVNKQLVQDPERARLVREAFEFVASGRYTTTDAVLKTITSMGLKTKKGRPLSKQSFARMLSNEIYVGIVESGDVRAIGKHDPIVSESLFRAVQTRLNGKSAPHKALNEDFPLSGVVLCAGCGKKITGGFAKGRKERYPRYWCWTKDCPKKISASRDKLHWLFEELLSLMQPTAEAIASMPEQAAAAWKTRKAEIAKQAEALSKRRADQNTLNQKAIFAHLEGKMSDANFEIAQKTIEENLAQIDREISDLDSERSTIDEIVQQARTQAVDLKAVWQSGNVNQRRELARTFFPEGLYFSEEKKFFEPRNTIIQQMIKRFFDDLLVIGVPDGI